MREGRYRVQVQKTANKVIARLPKDLLCRIAVAIDDLAVDPCPRAARSWWARTITTEYAMGYWRITYTVQDDVLVVTVVEVAPRGDAYRNKKKKKRGGIKSTS